MSSAASQPADGPSYSLQLPSPVDSRDLDRYWGWLGLDAELSQLFRTFHREYLDAWQSLERSTVPAIIEDSRKAAGAFMSQGDASLEVE